MNKKEIIRQQIINANNNYFFTGKLQDRSIKKIENHLNVILPDSFKWFLKEYGYGGLHGVEILGGGLTEVPACEEETLEWQKYGLPEGYVVIQNVDEYLYCLDTKKNGDGECPIIDWSQDGTSGIMTYASFYDYVIEKFNDSLENMGLEPVLHETP